MNSSVSNDSLSIKLYVKVIIAVIALLTVSSLLNWAVVNNHVGHLLGRLGLYVPMLLGLGLAVLRKPAPGMIWLLVGFSLVILLTLTHSVDAGIRGFVVASCYFLLLGQLVSGYRLQRYTARLSLFLVVFMILGLVYEQLWAGLPPGVLSVSPHRSALFFMNPNLAALGLCFLAFSAVTILSRKFQCLLWLGVFLAVLTTGSRSTLLALLVVCVAWLLFERSQISALIKARKLTVSLLVMIFVGGLWGAYEASPKLKFVVDRSIYVVGFVQDDFSDYVRSTRLDHDNLLVDEQGRAIVSRFVRIRLLARAWDVYLQAPWLGHGIDRAYVITPHNLYVFWPVAVGFLGWLVLPLLLFWLWFSSGSYYMADDWGSVSSADANPVRKLLAVFLAVIAMFLHDLFINPSLMAAFALAVFSSQRELVGGAVSDNDR